MHDLELWQQILLIIMMIVLLLACCSILAYAILSPAKEFKDDIEFKPIEKVKVKHVRNNRPD